VFVNTIILLIKNGETPPSIELIHLQPTILNSVPALAAQQLVAAVELRQGRALKTPAKREWINKSRCSSQGAKRKPDSERGSTGRVVSEQITSQPKTTLTYRTTTRQFQAEYIRDYSNAFCTVNVNPFIVNLRAMRLE